MKLYWKKVIERAVKSAAQGAILILGANFTNAFDADWQGVVGGAAAMAILSILTSLATTGIGPEDDPSAV
jgi:hypothetical protein